MMNYQHFLLLLIGVSLLLIATNCSVVNDQEEDLANTAKPDSVNVLPTGSKPSSSMYQKKYGRSLVYYAQVDKAGDYFRRMFIDSLSAMKVKESGELPEHALVVLETWFGTSQSTVYIRNKSDGVWLSDSFSPSVPVYSGLVLQASCNGCHATAHATDDTFTLPLLKKAMTRNEVQWIECNEYSFNPCELSVYLGK